MHRLTLAAATAVAALAAAPSAALAQAVAPAPTAYTAGQLVPPALGSTAEYAFGSHFAKTMPTGTTALVWDLTLVAGQTTSLTMQCPAGTVVADLNITGPTGGGEPGELPAFTPWYGQNAPSVTIPTLKPGPLTWSVLCEPSATATTTALHATRSPVTFPSSQLVPGLKRGEKLPKGMTILRSMTTGALNPGGTYVRLTKGCPAGAYQSQSVVTTPGSGGTGAVGNDVMLYPSAAFGSGPVTIYVLCAPPPKPVP